MVVKMNRDATCNNSKRDFLAAGDHVARWVERFSDTNRTAARQLADIAERTGWDRHPQRTLNTARTIYLRLPGDVRLWLRKREFVAVDADRTGLLQSLSAAGI
jgi:hypothetical protein